MNWNETNGKLEKTYVFKNQTDLAKFILEIAVFSDELNHHPDYIVFQSSKVTFTIFTHDQNKITTLDFQLAEKIDLYYNQ